MVVAAKKVPPSFLQVTDGGDGQIRAFRVMVGLVVEVVENPVLRSSDGG